MELILDKDKWDGFVEASPNGTLFHRWDFLQIVQKYTGYKLYPYGIYQKGELISVIPFFLRIHNGLKMMISPPPLPMANVPYLGFAMSPAFHELPPHEKILAWDSIVRDMHRGLKPSPNYICIGQTSDISDTRPFEWQQYEVDQQYTYVLDLNKPLKEIWDGFDRDCRKNINECKKHPLSFRQVSDVDRFNQTMKEHLTKDGPTFYHRRDPAYLAELLRTFPENIKLYFFYNGDEVVGVKINLGYKKNYMSWMGNVSVQKELSTNEYFYWELIKKAREDGYKRHENYGSYNQRLNLFKSKFNPALEPCFYVQKKDLLFGTMWRSYNAVAGFAKAIRVK